MKKTVCILLGILFFPPAQYAVHIDVGISYGPIRMNDAQIKNVYGDGYVYSPYMNVHIGKGFFASVGYEGGYTKSGTIGLYNDPTTFKLHGVEFFLGFQKRIQFIVTFIKVGGGYYFYKQTFESPYLKEFQVDSQEVGGAFNGGIKLIPFKGVFFSGEIKYVYLMDKPLEEKVNLGGLRFMAGLGFSI
ncbi:MAG: hypothetical protein WCC06_12875 [Candidatus Aminicenantales bacterium]